MTKKTKKDIVKEISKLYSEVDLKITQLKAKQIVEYTLNAIIETLLDEHRIELRNFGVFEVKKRKPRKARNPRSGESVDVPAKNVVTFKPGKIMEEKVRALTNVPDEVEASESEESQQTRSRSKAKRKSSGSARPKKKSPKS